jgi:hypothetical protein
MKCIFCDVESEILNIYMTTRSPQINFEKGYILCLVITFEFIRIFLEIQFILPVKYIFVYAYL